MLVFVGLGLNDERDLTLKGLEEARSCDLLFAEFYTSALSTTSEEIARLVGKEIIVLDRSEIEEKEDMILEPAEKKKVCLLVPGDPLISTTHVSLRIEAKKRGIETRVVHNASISSAAPSISGLQNYKFSKSASIAMPEKGFSPETPYDVVKENKARGLHTLLFLDIKVDGERRRLLTAGQAMKILLDTEAKRGEGVFTTESLCIVLGKVGSEDCVVKAGNVKDLLTQNFGEPPHTLIVPGRLHFMEEEYLREFGGLK